jgi:hypothetical protein
MRETGLVGKKLAVFGLCSGLVILNPFVQGCGSSSSDENSRTTVEAGPTGDDGTGEDSDAGAREDDADEPNTDETSADDSEDAGARETDDDASADDETTTDSTRDASVSDPGNTEGAPDASSPVADDPAQDDPTADDSANDQSASDADVGNALAEGDACDVLANADACGDRLCFGTPSSGYFCRDRCEDTDSPGDACGRDGVCLENRGPDEPNDAAVGCIESTECEPVTGDGCAVDEKCAVLRLEPLLTACVEEGPGQAWEPCNAAQGNACAAGLACLGSDLEDDEPGRCTPLCSPDDTLPDDCEMCVEQISGLGTCAQCAVLNDTCPAGSQCHPINETLGGVCVEYGPGTPGDLCDFTADGSCEPGVLCMEEELEGPDVTRCRQTCNSFDPECDPVDGRTTNCFDIGLFEPAFGYGELGLCSEDLPGPICIPEEGIDCADGSCIILDTTENGIAFGYCLDSCDPTLADCADNYACLPFSDGEVYAEPFLRGNGTCGEGCQSDDDCAAGTCLLLNGLESPGICASACDASVANDLGNCIGQCVPTGGGIGECVPATALCGPDDPCAIGSCSYLTEALDLGVCLLPCLVQDADACSLGGGQSLGSCNLRQDPQLHEGVCIGQEQPCDLTDPASCSDGQSCQVTGGAAFGGGAILCSEPGPNPLDAECDGNDDCAAGLVCITGEDPRTCRPICDPSSPTCGTGECTDLSESFYLPVGSVGACVLQ